MAWELVNGTIVTPRDVLERGSLTIDDRRVATAIEVNEGDLVTMHITNIEETRDELHGLALLFYNLNVVVDPGETKTIEFVANKPGVYAYYCSNFCSALHQEMQGYLFVKPKAGAAHKTVVPKP